MLVKNNSLFPDPGEPELNLRFPIYASRVKLRTEFSFVFLRKGLSDVSF